MCILLSSQIVALHLAYRLGKHIEHPSLANRSAFALCRNIKNEPRFSSCWHIDHNAAKWRSHCRAPAAAAVEQPWHPLSPLPLHHPITPATHHANKTTNWILIIFEQKQTSSSRPPFEQLLCHAHAADSKTLQILQNATSSTPAVVVVVVV